MCLRVEANGYGSGKATHVSVFVCLMRGEYDDQLKWPFRGDITIQLLNQSRDEGHWEKTFAFDVSASGGDENAGRVVGRERARGYGKFVAILISTMKTNSILKMTASSFEYQELLLRASETIELYIKQECPELL